MVCVKDSKWLGVCVCHYGLTVVNGVVDVCNPWCMEVCLYFALMVAMFELEKGLGQIACVVGFGVVRCCLMP